MEIIKGGKMEENGDIKIPEKELDKFIEEELDKDITQEDKVDESVEKHLQEMGFLWDRVQNKFLKDKTCFACKDDVNIEKGNVRVVEATHVERGVIAFVSICEKCYKKQSKEKDKKVKK